MSKPVDLRIDTREVFNEEDGFYETVGVILFGDEIVWQGKGHGYYAEEDAAEHLRQKLKELLS